MGTEYIRRRLVLQREKSKHSGELWAWSRCIMALTMELSRQWWVQGGIRDARSPFSQKFFLFHTCLSIHPSIHLSVHTPTQTGGRYASCVHAGGFSCFYAVFTKIGKQKSLPAWTQEAYYPLHSKYSFCCPIQGVTHPRTGGYPIPGWGYPVMGYPLSWPGWGTPHLDLTRVLPYWPGWGVPPLHLDLNIVFVVLGGGGW